MEPKLQDKNISFFPQSPSYSDPRTGLISKLPPRWIPYAQLMRIDRPAGLYAFYVPYLIGITYAACIASSPPEPTTLLRLAFVFLPFNMLLRGIACTWNDNVDQHFDRRVERCRHRPIARGAVSTKEANVFILVQLAVIYPFTTFFPRACFLHLLLITTLFFLYALMKRVTHYPQIVLGIPFAWAVFFCIAALGMEPLRGPKVMSTLALFGANVLWTITYDTIYAHQDVLDDEKAGVKSMALRFKHSTKRLTTILSVGQVALLAVCGICAGFSGIYFVGTVGGVSVALAYYIYDVDLKRPESCGAWFHDQFRTVGTGFLVGLIGEYLTRLTM